ncbi:porin family protein [Larkinella ripae]
MKKLFFVALISLPVSLFAQVQVGLRLGLHGSTIRYPQATLNPGFAAALPVQFLFAERWAIRAEPSFIQKGWRDRVDYTTDDGQPGGTGTMSLRYGVAELPLLVSFRQQVNKQVAYYGLVGPGIGYALGGRLTIRNATAEVFSDRLRFDNRIETGIWAGGGIEVPVGGLISFLDVRYYHGLHHYLMAVPKGTMYGFTVSVGCWLPTKK